MLLQSSNNIKRLVRRMTTAHAVAKKQTTIDLRIKPLLMLLLLYHSNEYLAANALLLMLLLNHNNVYRDC